MTVTPTQADVACVGLLREERMLVVRTRRYPEVWQPIGGRLAPGEDFAAAAVREVAEETGWALTHADLKQVLELPADVHPGTLRFYLAVVHEPGDPSIAEPELVEHRWVGRTEALRLPANPGSAQFFAVWARS